MTIQLNNCVQEITTKGQDKSARDLEWPIERIIMLSSLYLPETEFEIRTYLTVVNALKDMSIKADGINEEQQKLLYKKNIVELSRNVYAKRRMIQSLLAEKIK